MRTITSMTHVLGFLAWGGLFAPFGTRAFALFAVFYTLAGGGYLWLGRWLHRDSA